jgi:toxin YoeB
LAKASKGRREPDRQEPGRREPDRQEPGRQEPGRKTCDAVFQPEFREDLRYWVENDRRTAVRIFNLIEAVMRDPYAGAGKPEPLKYLGSGVWSRRITQEHRLVYVVGEERIDFIQARYHY